MWMDESERIHIPQTDMQNIFYGIVYILMIFDNNIYLVISVFLVWYSAHWLFLNSLSEQVSDDV